MDKIKIVLKKSYQLRRHIKFNNIKGGNFEESYDIFFENKKYTFVKSFIDDNNFILESPNINDTCVLISIIQDMNIAQIENINGDYNDCINYSPNKTGTFLLKLSLEFLKKYKKIFNIEWICVNDNSIKHCGNKHFNLMKLSTLTDGHTWYGKYGFRPIKYNKNKVKIDRYQLDKYDKNDNIIQNIKLKEVNFTKYFDKIIEKHKEFNIISNDLLNYIKLNPEKFLRDFIKDIIFDYPTNCKYFLVFYEILYDDIGLNILDRNFGLKI